jgi:hypothetical protein
MIEVTDLIANQLDSFCTYALVFQSGAHYMGFGLARDDKSTYFLYHYDGMKNGGYVKILTTHKGAT